MLCKGFIHFSSLNIVWGYIFCRIRISNQISALQIISSFTEHSDVPREALLSSLQLEPEVRSWIFNKFFGLTPIFYIFCWNLIASRISNQSRLEFHRQGTRIGPWLFLVMINDLTSSNALSSMWKFADNTTVSEIVPKFGASVLQDTVLTWCPSMV